jgi:hypothetical protein
MDSQDKAPENHTETENKDTVKKDNESKNESNTVHVEKAEASQNPKKGIKLPLMVIIPVIIVIVVLAVLLVFILHVGNASSSVAYTPVNAFSSSSLSSVLGGNWTLINNETANSSIIKADASSFPSGTVSAAIQEFIPASELSALSSNSTSNVSSFSSEVFYINSSSLASTVFNEAIASLGASLKNDTSLKYNESTVGNSAIVYIDGKVNRTNTTKTRISQLYILNGKDIILDTTQNYNFSYKQAEIFATYPFSVSSSLLT